MPITRRNFLWTSLAGIAGIILADSFLFERFFIETNEFYLGAATKSSKNISFVQVSDLHLHSISSALIHLAKKINKVQPDLILFTGDMLDEKNNLPLLIRFLNLIDKSIRKVAILGNWEHYAMIDINELNSVYKDNNCKLLINQSIRYMIDNKTVCITGVDDFIGGHADVNAATQDFQKSDYHIILSHCPQYRDYIPREMNKSVPLDFVLSGHTHGGQVNILGYVPYLPEGSGRYLKGWYNTDGPKMYVSKGIGTTLLPVRLGARAEIAIFHLST